MDWLFGWFYDLMYTLQKSICYILDFIRVIFTKLSGIDTVTVSGKQEDLLSHFLLSEGVRNAFLGVFLVGVILLFVFVIIAILKSEAADPQHKKTKGQILTKALQSFVIFLLIPFLLLAGIMLTNVIMIAVNSAMSGAMIDGNSNTLIGGQILVTSGHDAFKGIDSSRAEIERMFITGQLDYNNINVVKNYFNLADMNFFVGIAGGLVILVMFVMSAIMFVQRIFDVILLYIISPASISTIPLDDGGRFRIWREMLVSKVLGAYGIILSMNLFFLIIPQVSQITFFGDSFKDGIVQLLFVLGGAFAITKANMIISQLTGNNAGAQEAQQMLSNINSGIHMARTAGHVAAGAAGMVIGGTDFLHNRKRGASFGENVSSTIHSQRNRKQMSSENQSRENKPVGFCENNKKSIAEKNAKTQNSTVPVENIGLKPISEEVKTKQNAIVTNEQMKANDTPFEQQHKSKSAKVGGAVKGITRIATLPAGVAKDLIQGGIIVAGKNFMPRVQNVLKGNSVVNRAEVKNSIHKASEKGEKNDAADTKKH